MSREADLGAEHPESIIGSPGSDDGRASHQNSLKRQ